MLALSDRSGESEIMKTLGLVHSISANANIRTDVLEADSEQPVLNVLRTVFGSDHTADDLTTCNRLPDGPGDTADTLFTMTWGQWQSLNPVTVRGASVLHRDFGPARVTVLAGPDSGFTIGIDPRTPLLSRVKTPDSLTIVDPCMSRQPALLELGPARQHPFSSLGTTVFSPLSSSMMSTRNASEQSLLTRGPPPPGREPTHVAPSPVADPRPAKPPQWWAFLIPIGIGAVLAVVTGMWWFLLFSVSAPISGYIAYAMEKRRYTRDCLQCATDRRVALDAARTRITTLITEHKQSLQTSSGLGLGFGSALTHITIAEELHAGTDHLDGWVIANEVPIHINPLTTSVTVTGDHEQLRRMALSWLADQSFPWQPCSDLLQLPEMQGSRFDHGDGTVPAFNSDTSQQLSHLLRGDRPDSTIGVQLTADSSTSSLHLAAPAATATISLALRHLAQARTSGSTSAEGPVPGRSFIAALMPPGRFLTLQRRHADRVGVERLPNHGLGALYDDSPASIRRRWKQAAPGPVKVGRGLNGDVGIDLFNDGPHALVAGTTGSGKSILLQTWLLAMALEHPPRRLMFVLIDFKGGATFAPLEGLPHTDCVLDDFDSATAFRALVSVRAEITHRERLLAEHGCSDVLELAEPPPRLVVVIDEFHALMATHPKAAGLLEHLTALGRSLGVHLILATQRPLGVVTGQMKANINIRICLRVRDDADSFDVIGVSDAAHLPPDKPGAACLDSGSAIMTFRVAVPSADSSSAEVIHRPRLRPWQPGQGLPSQRGVNGICVENLLRAEHEATESTALTHPPIRPVVLTPLPNPDEVADQLSQESSAPGRIVTGIVDIPSHQKQSEWSYSPAVDGSAIIIGNDLPDVTTVLKRMAAGAGATHRVVALGRIASELEWAQIRCGMDTGWRFHAILDHLNRAPASAQHERPRSEPGGDFATIVVCSNWNEFIDSMDHHMAGETERLLKHASGLGLTFLLAGSRPAMSTSADFKTQVIFPPAAGGDGLSVGLSRQRFVGTWPKYRAVLVGPHALDAGGDGADVQLVAHEQSSEGLQEGDVRWHSLGPSWQGLAGIPELARPAPTSRSIPLGANPFGELVVWDPVRDGPVLNVRGSPQSGKTEIANMLQGMCAEPSSGSNPSLTAHDDAHLDTDPDAFDLLDGGIHVVTMPVRFIPGYGAPLAKAQNMGPLLVVGTHSRQDLSNLGLLRLPPLDGEPGTAWFVTEQRTQAVRVFPAETAPCFSEYPQEVP